MGVWIETAVIQYDIFGLAVTPFVGVWIETTKEFPLNPIGLESHPSWVCGLKLISSYHSIGTTGHTLRGCVD